MNVDPTTVANLSVDFTKAKHLTPSRQIPAPEVRHRVRNFGVSHLHRSFPCAKTDEHLFLALSFFTRPLAATLLSSIPKYTSFFGGSIPKSTIKSISCYALSVLARQGPA